ncbi:MAG: chemotaxis protein CheW [Bacteroidetes bacterium]|nr:chemotaxis protein CheW [Bacteroidota bacterium]
MDDEFIKEFVDEALELLSGIENDLLSIEEQGESVELELINKVFRAAHTIKGGSGFFDLEHITALAHKSETILDMLRTDKISPNAEVTNALLTAFDTLRHLVNNIDRAEDEDISEILENLDMLATESTCVLEHSEPQPQTITVQTLDSLRSFELPASDLERSIRESRNLFWVNLDFIKDVERRGITIMALFRILLKYGEIIESKLDFHAIGGLDAPVGNVLPVCLIVAIEKDLEGIQSLLYTVEPKNIHPLEVVDRVDSAEHAIDASAEKNVAESSADNTLVSQIPQNSDSSSVEVRNQPVDSVLSQPKIEGTLNVPKEEVNPMGEVRLGSSAADETIRIQVGTLETLMNLAGELVLSRNELRTVVKNKTDHSLISAEQRINQVTTELQDVIMQTRLQPVGNVFNKFPRVVRDLSRQLNKQINLIISGKDVALDKTLIEGISDPLMHMVRNAIDHGIETVDERRTAGKSVEGTVRIEARHEAGQVIIEIADDGKGLDADHIAASSVKKGLITQQQADEMSDKDKLNLIFQPGLSTAEKLSDISGRGVGMDVVKTNLIRLGGHVDIQTRIGYGSTFRIKLPLTLAIIPTLIVSAGKERFAIPQANIKELVSIQKDEAANFINSIGTAQVLVLRDTIIPFVQFRSLFNIETDVLVTKRLPTHEIVVLTDGVNTFATEFDWLHTTEEVVVKPLGKRLKHLNEYAGATILGDGSVALILDSNGLAQKAAIHEITNNLQQNINIDEHTTNDDIQPFLLFGNGADEQFAVLMDHIDRIERITWNQVELLSKRRTIQYRGGMLPLFLLEDCTDVKRIDEHGDPVVLVSEVDGKTVGLLGTMPINVVHTQPVIDMQTHRQTGILGSLIIEGKTTLLADIEEIVRASSPSFSSNGVEHQHVSIHAIPSPDVSATTPSDGSQNGTSKQQLGVLLAEDSDFFRSQVKRFISDAGYDVYEAPDGEKAWEVLLANLDKIQMVVTDIEMPHLDGLGLTSRIRADERTSSLPIIAVSSLASDEDQSRGFTAGVTEYQVKLDRAGLLNSIQNLTAVYAN